MQFAVSGHHCFKTTTFMYMLVRGHVLPCDKGLRMVELAQQKTHTHTQTVGDPNLSCSTEQHRFPLFEASLPKVDTKF